jgi:DNA primase
MSLTMSEWLHHVSLHSPLSEAAEGYALSRGVREHMIRDMGMFEWDTSAVPETPIDPAFVSSAGPLGQRINGRLCTPVRSPRGEIIGIEARRWDGVKHLFQYLAPQAEWHPVFLGLTSSAMQRIWDGGDVWIVEGVFDLGPLEQVVPQKDVVLATLRARISPHHVKFLRRFCRGTVHMVYDNDETGRRQTEGWTDPVTGKRYWGAIQSLSRVGIRVRDVRYRGGKDPGEIWDAGGLPALKRAFQ